LRPALGLRPWFALERRAFAFLFWVRLDIGLNTSGCRKRVCADIGQPVRPRREVASGSALSPSQPRPRQVASD